jgi:outer membrane lipoprotein-sorting protein
MPRTQEKMTMTSRSFWGAACLLAFLAPASAQTLSAIGTAGSTDNNGKARPLAEKEIIKLFADLEKGSDEVKTVVSTIKKTEVDPIFVIDSVVSRGIFKFVKPGMVYQQITDPVASASVTILVKKKNNNKVYHFLPKSGTRPKGRVEIWTRSNTKGEDKNESLEGMFAGISFKLEDLKPKFDVKVNVTVSGKGEKATTLYKVDLTPLKTQKKLKEKISKIEIWTDGKTPWPLRVRRTDPTDTVTDLEFGDLRFDTKIDPSVFVQKLSGYQVVRH